MLILPTSVGGLAMKLIFWVIVAIRVTIVAVIEGNLSLMCATVSVSVSILYTADTIVGAIRDIKKKERSEE